jgi:hypothetical protein
MRRGVEMSGSQTQTVPAQQPAATPAQPAAAPAPAATSFNPFVGNTVGTDLLIKSFGPTQPIPESLLRRG